jgi:site-specific DNA recombinase
LPLDAHREACAAFILSQKHEGWIALPTRYDDGGFSGGTMERPALKRLIADIEASRIDVVMVYKVDRLTRALSDFSKLVDIFDRRGVSFVSITQQFNTTTSMGRLTLNVLLSFAQFEREVIGERVRDKIAASKKKGMWMGGTPPLGYDVRDRKLVVNNEEARVVVDIFRRYLALKSVHALRDELARADVWSKRRTRRDNGGPYGERPFSRGALYQILQNRLYRGEMPHKGAAYPGEHAAIVDQPLWDEVQVALAANRVERAAASNSKRPSLLTSLLFDEAGERLTPTYAIKKGTRFRYYVSTSLLTEVGKTRASGRRIPAVDLERVVIKQLQALLADHGALLDGLDAWKETIRHQQLISRSRQLADELGAQAPDAVKATLTALVRRIEIKTDRVDIAVSRAALIALLSQATTDPAITHLMPADDSDDLLTLTAPARLKRAGREIKMVVANGDHQSAPDPSLLRIIARAHDMRARLVQNAQLTVHDSARAEGVSSAYVYSLLRLPWLAPDITTAIVNGRNPPQLTATKLMRLTGQLPVNWAEQRQLLGFGR